MCIIIPKIADFCGFWFVYFAGLVCFFQYVVCRNKNKKRAKNNGKKEEKLIRSSILCDY